MCKVESKMLVIKDAFSFKRKILYSIFNSYIVSILTGEQTRTRRGFQDIDETLSQHQQRKCAISLVDARSMVVHLETRVAEPPQEGFEVSDAI